MKTGSNENMKTRFDKIMKMDSDYILKTGSGSDEFLKTRSGSESDGIMKTGSESDIILKTRFGPD